MVLALIDYYLPGFRGGGPTRAVAHLAEHLSGRFELLVATRDRDLGSASPYPHVAGRRWHTVGAARVRYLAPRDLRPWRLGRILRETRHDLLYLNSCFSPPFTVLPLVLRALRLVPLTPLVVAPRGELAPAALALKSRKKRAYLAVARRLSLYAGAVWQASSAYEEADIRREFGSTAQVVVAPDLPAPVSGDTAPALEPEARGRPLKRPGLLSAAFLGRISPMKNLRGALQALAPVRGAVELHIYGPAEDLTYWRECQEVIRSLPATVAVRYHGALSPGRVPATLRQHHILFLPSLGENFGHAIHEAMAAGCPVLISDRTPWRGLEPLRAGWDIPLSDASLLVEALQRCVDMDQDTYQAFSDGARRLAQQRAQDPELVAASATLFEVALSGVSGAGSAA